MIVDAITWEPLSYAMPGATCLRIEGHELARVNPRASGDGWLATVAMHRRDYRRRATRVFDTREDAMRAAEAWTRASWSRIVAELPRFVADGCSAGRLAYPACNPETPLAEPLDAIEAAERRVTRSGPVADHELTARRRR